MTALVIRHAQLTDIETVVAIDAACDSASHWKRERYEKMVEAPANASVQRVLLVAVNQEQVLGFAVASAVAGLQPREVELENLAIAFPARGRGIGSALLRAVIAWAAEEGGESVLRLEVRSRNQAAIRLYQRLGFVRTAERRGYYNGPVDDAVCMERALYPKGKR